jgi:hypothetical protein
MASGINSTLRQVGIATGVAALGAILAGRVTDLATERLAGPLGPRAHEVAEAIGNGQIAGTLRSAPPQLRATVAQAAEASFAGALNTVLLIGGLVALFAAVASLVLIRSRDFAHNRLGQTHAQPEAESLRARADREQVLELEQRAL